MRDERTVLTYAGWGVEGVVFGSSEGVRRVGVRAGVSDVAREMFWAVVGLAFGTLGVVWVVQGEVLRPGVSHGGWVGVLVGWVAANGFAGLRAVRVARGVRVIEVGPGRLVMREAGREIAWGREEIAGVRFGRDYVGVELVGRRRGAARAVALVSDLPGRELGRVAAWLREGLESA